MKKQDHGSSMNQGTYFGQKLRNEYYIDTASERYQTNEVTDVRSSPQVSLIQNGSIETLKILNKKK